MLEKVSASDFDYDIEENVFTHRASDFMLDGDFVLLIPDNRVIEVFRTGSGTYDLDLDVLEDMRSIVREHFEEEV